MLQFQAEDDWRTPMLVFARVSELMLAQALLNPDDPQVEALLSIVVYGGAKRWTAAKDARTLIGFDPPVSMWRAQPSCPFRVLEERFCPMLDRPKENLAVLIIEAERCRSCRDFISNA